MRIFHLSFGAILLLVVEVANAAILYTDAAKVLGQMKMTIVAGDVGKKFVFYKFQIKFSANGSPIYYCHAGEIISPDKYDVMPDISVFEFFQYYGPLPNTLTPVAITDPWCYQ